MGQNLYIDAAALEHRPFEFEAALGPALFDLSDRWSVAEPVRAEGTASLLSREGLRAIRVRGWIRASVDHVCDRCLDALRQDLASDFDLCYYPADALEDGGNQELGRDETEVGFYEGERLGLVDVVREQILLWLPVRSLCSPECKGLCPVCGSNRNAATCECRETFVDPRWEALRQLDLAG